MSVGLSSFLLFWCFMSKGEKIRGVNNFFDAMEVVVARSHVRIHLE